MPYNQHMGRPKAPFDPEAANEVCFRLSGGESLVSICKDERLPGHTTIFQWISQHPEFAENYARARQFWAHAEFERMMEIADTPMEGEKIEEGSTDKGSYSKTTRGDMTDHRRLQVDTRKWALARMFPKVYGDYQRNDTQLSGAGGGPITLIIEPVKTDKSE